MQETRRQAAGSRGFCPSLFVLFLSSLLSVSNGFSTCFHNDFSVSLGNQGKEAAKGHRTFFSSNGGWIPLGNVLEWNGFGKASFYQ